MACDADQQKPVIKVNDADLNVRMIDKLLDPLRRAKLSTQDRRPCWVWTSAETPTTMARDAPAGRLFPLWLVQAAKVRVVRSQAAMKARALLLPGVAVARRPPISRRRTPTFWCPDRSGTSFRALI